MRSPEDITTREFLVSLRGFDREQVRNFQREVAELVGDLQQQAADLQGQLAAQEPEERPAATQEETDTAATSGMFAEIGAETQRILHAAQEAAEHIRRNAKVDSDREQQDARGRAAKLIADGERRREKVDQQIAELERSRDILADELRGASRAIGNALERIAPPPPAVPPAAAPAPARATAPQVATAQSRPTPATDAAGDGQGPVVELAEEATVRIVEPPAEASADVAHAPSAEPPTDAEPDAHALRSAALGPLHPKLVRRIKRELTEAQNIALDHLRRAKGRADVHELLPDGEDPAGMRAAAEYLDQSWRSGVEAGARLAGVPLTEPATTADLGDAFARETNDRVRSVVAAALRTGPPAADLQTRSDRVSAAFADLKGGHAEDLAAVHLIRAYETGLLRAWAAGGVPARRWVMGREQRCPEARCRNNDQGGPLPVDEPFPSGHEVPPVHVGCTCTTQPVAAHT